MNKILVTGSNGFIASSIIESLQKRYTIVATSRSESKIQNKEISFIKLDLSKQDELSKIDKELDGIIHCAGQTGLAANEEVFYENNYLATKNLVDRAIELKVKFLLFFSTPSLYLSKENNENIEETDIPQNIMTSYSKTKLLCEKYIEEKAHNFESVIILRPGTVYGPHSYTFSNLVIEARKTRKITTFSKEYTRMSMTFIKNLVHAIDLMLRSPKKGFNIYNFSNEEPTCLSQDFLESFYKKNDIDFKKTVLPFTPFFYLALTIQLIYKKLNIGSTPPLSPYIICNFGRNRILNIDKFKSDYKYSDIISKKDALLEYENWLTKEFGDFYNQKEDL